MWEIIMCIIIHLSWVQELYFSDYEEPEKIFDENSKLLNFQRMARDKRYSTFASAWLDQGFLIIHFKLP